MAESNKSVFDRPPSVGAVSSSNTVDANKESQKQPTQEEKHTADTVYFLSSRAVMNCQIPNMNNTKASFRNYRFSTKDPGIIEGLRSDFIPRNFVREVSREEYRNYGKPPPEETDV